MFHAVTWAILLKHRPTADAMIYPRNLSRSRVICSNESKRLGPATVLFLEFQAKKDDSKEGSSLEAAPQNYD